MGTGIGLGNYPGGEWPPFDAPVVDVEIGQADNGMQADPGMIVIFRGGIVANAERAPVLAEEQETRSGKMIGRGTRESHD